MEILRGVMLYRRVHGLVEMWFVEAENVSTELGVPDPLRGRWKKSFEQALTLKSPNPEAPNPPFKVPLEALQSKPESWNINIPMPLR